MTQTFRNILIGVGVVTAAAIGYTVTRPSTDTSQKVSSELSTPQPQINISTAGEVPLTFQMSSATVDIQWISRTGGERDLLESEFVGKMKALGFTRLWNFGDGSIMNFSYAPVPATERRGYNGKPSDFPTPQGETFESFGGGVLAKYFPSDFLDKTLEFERVVGVKSDVTLNKKETWAQCKYKIDNSTGEYIKLASETVTTSWKWQDYLAWAKKTRDSITKYYGTTKKLIADEPNMFKYNTQSKDWRANINPTSLTGMYGGRVYWQIWDQVKLGVNLDSNVRKLNVFFDDSIPNQIQQFKTLFPGWKIFGTQIGIVDNRPEADSVQFINKNIMGCCAWGRFYQSFVENQAIQPLCIQMSLKGLIDEEANNTKVITMLNTLLKPGYNVTAITFDFMEGCSGVSIHSASESKKHTILITNLSKNTYIPKLFIDGKKKTPTYTIDRMYSTDGTWQGETSKDAISTITITILPCSVNVITFTLGNTTAESSLKQ